MMRAVATARRVGREVAAPVVSGARCFGVQRDCILLRDYAFKGKIEPAGAVVSVKGGYLRNYLLPQQIAVPATPANMAKYADANAKLGPSIPADDLATHRPNARRALRLSDIEAVIEKEVAPNKARIEKFRQANPYVEPQPEPDEGEEKTPEAAAAAPTAQRGDKEKPEGGDAAAEDGEYTYVPYEKPSDDAPTDADKPPTPTTKGG